jgi:3'-5' exoribonuclease
MEKQVFVEGICAGDEVDAPFLVEEAELRDGGRNGRYITCRLSDATGSIGCKIWGRSPQGPAEVEEMYRALQCGSVYRIAGQARVFRDVCEVNVNEGILHIARPLPLESIRPEAFCCAFADIPGNRKKIEALAGSIDDASIRDVVTDLLARAPGFFEKPAARFKHHHYRGGLAEHTLEVARFALAYADHMPRSGIDRDIVLAGALIHDIGKTAGFQAAGLGFTSTPEYSLTGHITPGIALLSSRRDALTPECYLHLVHIIQSHHGPHGEIQPHTAEAWAVHCADFASATLRMAGDDVQSCSPGDLPKKGTRSGVPVYRFPE